MNRPSRPLQPQRGSAPLRMSDSKRWAVMAVVLIGSLGVYAVERFLRTPDAPIVGYASVADGDTLTISGMRIRLVDIDAPELDQSCSDVQGREWLCGRQATNQLRERVRGQEITCTPQSRDQYGRSLSVCRLPDKTDLNAWMVQQGWAVTSGFANVYVSQQAEAQAARRGIWSGSFTPPREWRHQNPRSAERRKN